jgi:hypothetical protein
MKRYCLVTYNPTSNGKEFKNVEILAHLSTLEDVNYLFYKIYNYNKGYGKDLTNSYYIEVHELHEVKP